MKDTETLALLERDREAGFAALLEQYYSMLWWVCARRLNHSEDIQECVYATLEDFSLQWERFQSEQCSLKAYLTAIADRKAVDKYRQNLRWSRSQQAVLGQMGSCEEDSPGEAMDLRLLIEQLPELDRKILRLRYLEGVGYWEISRMLQMNYETVKKRGSRSIRKIKRMLER